MLVVLTLPFIASASPVGIVVLSTCGVIVGLAERRELATTGALRGPVEATARLPLLAFAIVGSLFMVLTQHWTPQEELVLEGGKAAVGRVMGSQGGQILLLGEANEAIWVKEANIRNRRLCGSATQPWILRPLTELLAPQSRYDPC